MKKDVNPELLRLLEGLLAAGVQHGSRNRKVAEKTGYSESSVLKALSGNTPRLTPRFSRTVCEAFGISYNWVEKGEEPVLAEKTPRKPNVFISFNSHDTEGVAKIQDLKVLEDEKIFRLLEGLKAAGVQHGSRNRTVAKKTGYSEHTVLKVLSGNTPRLTPRFSRTVCEAFGISCNWVEKGEEPVLAEETPRKPNVFISYNSNDPKDVAMIQVLKVLEKMPKSTQWRAVGVLEEMLEGVTKKTGAT